MRFAGVIATDDRRIGLYVIDVMPVVAILVVHEVVVVLMTDGPTATRHTRFTVLVLVDMTVVVIGPTIMAISAVPADSFAAVRFS